MPIIKSLYRRLRIAIINSSLDSPYHSYGDHWLDGFRDAGCNVDVYKYEDIVYIPFGYDLYFFVEIRYDPNIIPWYISPRVLYSWDAHILGPDYYKLHVGRFDTLYLASKIDVNRINSEGINNVRWLPEACNPRVHKDLNLPRTVDIGFVGRGNHERPRSGFTKDDFIAWIKSSPYKTVVNQDVWGSDYVSIMNQAKLAFDRVIAHNVGTRIFESAAMGCVPLWADSGVTSECGILDLMTPYEHYVPYNDTIDGISSVISELLNDQNKIDTISMKAKKHVLQNHTYAVRALSVIKDHVKNIYEGYIES